MVEIIFSLEELKKYSAGAGLGFNFIVKEAFLFSVLDVLREYDFVLKGGTAINKGFLKDKQRFSEDLDFDTNLDIKEVEQILQKEKLKIKKRYYTKHARGFEISYTYKNIKDIIKIDFSMPIKGNYFISPLKSEFIPLSLRFRIYTLKELIKQKERAFLNRKEWKDLYDLFWISKFYPKQFQISNKKKFREVLNKIKIPKIANAYIPLKNRVEWSIIIEEFLNMLGK